MNKQSIYLASGSPRRKELLCQIGLKFKITPSNFKENMNLKLSHIKLAETLAMGKAQASIKNRKSGIIIGCDTFLVLNNKRIGKPKNAAEAKKILKTISDKFVNVYSGIAVIDLGNGKKIVDSEVTKVKIKKLSPKEIDRYVATGEPLDKAGAFAIQGKGAVFIEKINGCYSNVIGLPLFKLYLCLNKLNINIWNK